MVIVSEKVNSSIQEYSLKLNTYVKQGNCCHFLEFRIPFITCKKSELTLRRLLVQVQNNFLHTCVYQVNMFFTFLGVKMAVIPNLTCFHFLPLSSNIALAV